MITVSEMDVVYFPEEGKLRFRVNLFYQQGSLGIVYPRIKYSLNSLLLISFYREKILLQIFSPVLLPNQMGVIPMGGEDHYYGWIDNPKPDAP